MNNDEKLLSYLQQAMNELQRAHQRLRAVEEKEHEPIAIVAMSCRFPGDVRTPEDLWKLLLDGKDAISDLPQNRGWNLDALDVHGRFPVREGGFVYDADAFDPAFFGISPREALAIDPQQRLLLEISWEAFERAGIDPASLQGSQSGVFVGVIHNDYDALLVNAADEHKGFVATGSTASVASGRIAYTFGFQGPAISVDTACSSSLVAVHLACRALRHGECSLALAGGVTVMATPAVFVAFDSESAGAPDGRCKSFSAEANGSGWAEGAGMLLLERLSDAVRNGHPVLAVLRGSAVNQDGRSQGLTAPNGPAQERVIQQALDSARLTPKDVDVVEAHGTGTTLGDPIEAQAILATYGEAHSQDRPLWLGSLKSNLGHTQAAAGVGSVIKMVLALQHGLLPKTLHAPNPSPHIDWSPGTVKLLNEPVVWTTNGHPRRAGVSAFGISGTNAHVILEEAPAIARAESAAAQPASEPPPAAWPVLLSAKSEAAVRAQAKRLREHLLAQGDVALADVAYSLATTRAHFEHRAALLVKGRDELLSTLESLAQGHSTAVVGRSAAHGKLAVLFTGQGSQRPTMGRALYDAFPVFRDALDTVAAHLDRDLDRPLRDVLFAPDGSEEATRLDQTAFTQPALFALELALFQLLQSFGLKPALLLGHSIGELVAAHVGGVLSLQDACTLVAARAKLMQALPQGGAMVTLQASEQEVRDLLKASEGRAGLAALNGPLSTVVAGDEDAVLEIARQAEALGRKTTRLRVSHAFHSAHMDGMLDDFRRVAQSLTFHPARIPIISNLTGARATDHELASPDYWVRHVRHTVRFLDGVRALHAEGARIFLELGPHAILSALAQDALGQDEGPSPCAFLPTLRKGRDDAEAFTAALGALHTSGLTPDWSAFFSPLAPRKVSLPTYAFQRERFWPDASTAPTADVNTIAPLEGRFWQAIERGDLDALSGQLHVDGDEQRTALALLLPTLAGFRHERQEQSTVDAWRYRVAWKPLPTAETPADLAGTWLVVVPSALADDALLPTLTAALTRRGARVLALCVSHDHVGRAALTEHLRTAIAETAPIRGVLSLLALDERPLADHSALPAGLALSLSLVQALGDLAIEGPLWFFTRGAVSIGHSDPLAHPAQAMTWGLGRVVGLEHPDRWGGLVDVGAGVDESAVDRLLPALAQRHDEDQLALRPAGLYARRFVRAPLGDAPPARDFTPGGTILITGGTGAIGAHVARWLARKGAQHLVLVSRRGAEAPGASELHAELSALGARTTLAACDVADRNAVATLLEQLDAGGSPVRAVFHASGIEHHAPLDATSFRDLAEVVSGKVQGARHLHDLLGSRPLDAFVLFSSGAAVWGGGQQGGYAAANAFLDALAEQRRSFGLTATSVAWGAWGGGGMATERAAAHLQQRGLLRMAPSLALAALALALEHDETTVTVADIDWTRFAPAFSAARSRPLLRDLPEAQRALEVSADASSEHGPAPDLLDKLRSHSESEQLRLLASLVRHETALVLGHEGASHVDPDKGFMDLGLDSLMTVELRRRLQKATGIKLPATLAFDHPSAHHVALFLRDSLAHALGTRLSAERDAAALPALGATSDEPIAIVGVALRLPGGIGDVDALWEFLAQGRDAVEPIPHARWDAAGLYDPDPDAKTKSYVRHAAMLDQVDLFDAAFFGISPREAKHLDPQHRLLLESAWQALEEAGIVPPTLKDSPTGVFVGIGASEYAHQGMSAEDSDAYAVQGTSASFAAGRLAYTLGLQGPALSVDTACSSSLVALHLACQALRQGECNLALAAGVSVMASPEAFVLLSRLRALAPDGRSKTFSANADGYGRGEGVVVLALERLGDALARGRRVLALVRGSAMNHDGASSGLTAPNGTSQQKVLRAALHDARITPADVDVVECHGTGTSLGDPIEVQALAAVYAEGRPAEKPVLLGALKTNIGHLEAASGLAGVAKMVASLRHDALPPTLHATPRNPLIEWDALAVDVVDAPRPWARHEDGSPRRAGVSAFGLSGTNAHVILEEAPAIPQAEPATSQGASQPLPAAWPVLLSARSEAAVRAQAQRLRDHLLAHDDLALVDVAHSLATTRAHFEHRAALLAHDRDELLAALESLAQGKPAPSTVLGRSGSHGKVVFVFPGQGSQWDGMALSLLDASPVFRTQLEACERALAPHVDWSLLAVLRRDEGAPSLDRVDVVQPALFAVMVSLAALWRSLGVEPAAVVGHSQGEIAAAFVAGALSLEDAARIAALRSKALTTVAGKGAMAAVELGASDLQSYLAPWGDRLSIAAVNSPRATLVSGEPAAVDALLEALTAAQLFARKIRVDYASHSAQMDAVRAELLADLESLDPRACTVPLYSTVTGTRLDGSELDGAYWYRNLRQTVLFSDATERLLDDGHRFFVEVSPHPVLTLALRETCERSPLDPVVVGSVRRDEGHLARLLLSWAELSTRGLTLDWNAFFAPFAPRKVSLSTYPFQRERFWLDASTAHAADVTSAGLTSADHPLLGAAVALADRGGFLFTGRLSLAEHPWLEGHAVFGTPILPGTGFLELALHVAHRVGLDTVEELTLETPLALPSQGAVLLQISVGPVDDAGRRSLSFHSRREDALQDGPWTRHASGSLSPATPSLSADLHEWPPSSATPVDPEGLYATFANLGLAYGPGFQGLRSVYKRGDELFAEARLPEAVEKDAARFALHPALLDSALHALAFGDEQRGAVALPFSWSGVSLRSVGATTLRVRFHRPKGASSVSIILADAAGDPLASVQALAMRATSAEQLRTPAASHHDALFRIDWSELQCPTSPPIAPSGVLLGTGGLDLALNAPLARYADLAALRSALDRGASPPSLVVAPFIDWPAGDLVPSAHEATALALALLQAWLADERLASSRLVLITRRAVATHTEEDVKDLARAPLWGLARSAQSEHPDLPLFLVDIDLSEASQHALLGALDTGERQLALRNGKPLIPRLAHSRSTDAFIVPQASTWRLHIPTKGTFDALALVDAPEAQAPLAHGQVRIAVHAAGLNFRDVVDTLGMYPGDAPPLGGEGAGIITEVGPGVSRYTVGDRVMGVFGAAFGPTAIADARMICPIPHAWSFAQAASVPIIYLTAYHGLVDLGHLKPDQRVLIHAAAGGVGTAAVQLARHLGAEVFATASPGKWSALRALGFDDAHLASSRDLGFEQHFLRSTHGRGMDVVLDCLAREFVDASLRLMPSGGRFIEMGKTDIREPDAIALAYPGVVYRAFDITEAGPDRIGQMLAELLSLFERGVLHLPPITSWDIRHATQAFRTLAQARHVGKFVLTIPRPFDPEGTVLITGGTGTLGALVARHLVARHSAKHLLLTSRQGAHAPGAEALRSELEALGASVTLAACDVADPRALRALLDSIPSAHPLTAVVHAAGTLDDGPLGVMSPERIARVFAPKLDAAWHLHELTRDKPLAAFVLFSAASGVLGGPGQSNYAAANAFLDALAHHRRAQGLPAAALAWGYWAERSGMTRHLSAADTARMKRAGVRPLGTDEALSLFDAALLRPEPALVPAPFDFNVLSTNADGVPPLFQRLVRARVARKAASNPALASSLAEHLSSRPPAERERVLLDVVRTEAASVLGLASFESLDPHRPLQELGLDSLMAIELRNRLAAAIGLRLHATLLFDYPTPTALSRFFTAQLFGGTTDHPVVPLTPAGSEDPIAIVAMSCRFPGDVRTPEDLWKLLLDGKDAISGFPQNRGWSLDALDAPGRFPVREGGFFYDADAFDPAFFGISPREALAADPQQRILLEITWEAFERAGIDPASLQGSQSGVFVGVWQSDYGASLMNATGEYIGLAATGSAASVASGRIAYTFGLQGPAISVDTACSSSLVAVHLACQALRHGECSLALAGGVTIMATPGIFIAFDSESAGAPDGRCKAFSAEANGSGWAEGAGMLLLERLSDAVQNGHPVLAILRGSAVNQDGRSQGLTAPNGPAQERVIRQALDSARLTPKDVDVVEAHGTGTALGDPIEAQAVLATYGEAHSQDRPLWLGSLKSNLGHTQAAAGVGGIIKVVLALQHGLLPKTLHAQNPSPHIDWSPGTVKLLNEPVAWTTSGHPRRAGVSSFGVSGTNAHVILEEAPAATRAVPGASHPALQPLPAAWPVLLSARSEAAVRAQAQRLRDHLLAHDDLALADVAYSLATTRAHFEHRAALVARDRDELLSTLESLAQDKPTPSTVLGRSGSHGKVVFVFPGQGSQWDGMALSLLDASPVFRTQLEACERALAPHVDWSLLAVLRRDEGAPSLDRVDVVQPALFAVMLSLAALWRSLGVEPAAVVGHSQGEIAAAFVAGALSLEDAARIAALRSKALTSVAGQGAMAAVELGASDLQSYLAPWGDKLSIAAVNSPRATLVSGEPAAIDALVDSLTAAQVFARRVRVDYASHSAQMDAVRDELVADLANIAPRTCELPLYSTVTGTMLDGSELDGAYWYRNLRQTVLFSNATERLLDDGHRFFVEISPHPVLTLALRETCERSPLDPVVVGSIRRDEGHLPRLLLSWAELYTRGLTPDWNAFFTPFAPRKVSLPTYAFQRERFWLDAPNAHAEGVAPAAPIEGRLWQAIERGDLDALSSQLHVDGDEQRAALALLLPTLSSFHHKRQEQSAVDAWRYRITWRPLTTGATPADLAGTWLLVVPSALGDDALPATLTDALTRRGARVLALRLSQVHMDRAALAEHLREAVAEIAPVRGVLSLLALDERPLADHAALPAGLALSLALVQALGDLALEAPLWLLTRGAVSIGPSDPLAHATQAMIWGLGRVVGLEHPERWGGLVDLGAALDASAVGRLLPALAQRHDEDQLALRPAGLYARRFVRAPLSDAPAARGFMPRGTILITGGTGAIGAHVARWLARKGAEHLVLISRRGAQAEGSSELHAELTALGARTTLAACDVADRSAVATLLEQLDAEGSQVRAVFHAGGIDHHAPLAATSLEDLAEVVSGKVQGARHLHDLLGARPLDAFVLFSSGAAVWGGGQQGGYAAANAFLDALAEQRRSLGLTATSVAWGAWGGGGMATGPLTAQLEQRGLLRMAPSLAVAALALALEHDETTVTVADFDWARFAPSFSAARPRPLLRDLPEAQRALEASADASSEHDAATGLLDELRSRSESEQIHLLSSLVRHETALVLGHTDASQVDLHKGFMDLGLDSLMTVELRRRLQKATNIKLPATLAFDHPSAHHVALFLRESLAHALGTRLSVERGAAALPALRSASDEPIAIVGMALRLPGGIGDVDALWEFLHQGRDAVEPIPHARWDAVALYDPDPDAKAKSYVRHAAMLDQVDLFDPAFFGISPREAKYLDPQHRLLLESAWQALEDADIVPSTLKDSPTGVFVGIGASEYALRNTSSEEIEAYALQGTAGSFAAGRLAYTLGLQGPALSIDTACSSSLVALHLACQALRQGECSLALAAGVSVMASPGLFVVLSRMRALAPDGRSKTFSANADGYGRGEGVVVLALERLGDALARGRRVLAIVRGTAVNHDGASSGITAPNGTSHQKVLRAALHDARIGPADVDVVECHGTGTSLGDPIEVQALAAVYAEGRPAEKPLLLGAIKTNIGHLEAASGLAGVAKIVASLRHDALPPTLHTSPRNPLIEWDALAVDVVDATRAWARHEDGSPRRAGVSAFGLSGTNAHVILEEAPAIPQAEPTAAQLASEPLPAAWPVLLSAKSELAVRAQAQRLRDHLLAHDDLALADVAYSLATTRATFEHRAALVVHDRDELLSALDSLAQGKPSPSTVLERSGSHGKVVFVFPGQGSQWEGMALSLLDTSPVFRAQLEACERALAPHVDWSLLAVLRGEEGAPPLDRVDVVQPVLFSMMVSLAALWRSMGVEPDAVVGHSQGEIAAACVAGALSLEDAAKLVALRSRALVELAGQGAMAAVELPEAEAARRLQRYGDRLSIGAINSPRFTTISGAPPAVAALLRDLESEGVFALKLSYDFASHSAQVESIREKLLDLLSWLKPRSTAVPFYSTVSGAAIDGSELDAAYWYRNLRQPVRFADAVQSLLAGEHHFFVEVSPSPVLTLALHELLEASERSAAVVGSLWSDEGDLRRFLVSLSELYVNGFALDWTTILPPRKRVPLPTYPFQRERFWLDASEAPAAGVAPLAPLEGRFWQAIESGNIDALSGELHVDGDEQRAALALLLPTLASFRHKRQEQSTVDAWRYRVTWKPLTTAGAPADLAGTWLVVMPAALDDDALPSALTEALTRRGARVLALRLSQAHLDREALAEHLRQACAETAPPRGVLSLLALDESPLADHSTVPAGLAFSLTLVQALGDIALDAPLWLFTRGAVSIGHSDPITHPTQAMTWGLGRVVGLEHPERWGGLVDVGAAIDASAVGRLLPALALRHDEDQIALRPAGLYARRLVRAPLGDAPPARTFTARGTLLITGGTGAAGAHVARWLAREGAEHLVLISRRGAEAPGASELHAELTALGARATFAACDVADRRAVATLLEQLDAEGSQVRAVFHASGIGHHAPLAATSFMDLADVVSAKVLGAKHLHDLLGPRPLDAFVLFSSIAGVWGGGQQAGYAAGNAFLDALAEQRRSLGLTATSVAWGAWGGGGMFTGPLAAQLEQRGLSPMAPSLAVAALAQALEHDETTVTVADIDWARFAPSFSAARSRPLLRDLPEAQRALEASAGSSSEHGPAPDLLDKLRSHSESEQIRLLAALVCDEAAHVLGHEGASQLDPDKGFFDLGLDSIMTVELRRRLQQATGMKLPATLAFDHPSPHRVALFLRDSLAHALGTRLSVERDAAALPALGAASDEPIAIVGMALRMPGGIGDVDALWEFLHRGRDAVEPIPQTRWDADALYDPDPDADAKSYVRHAAMLDQIDLFDPGFFGISPREAKHLDPQHRLLLESAWQALEEAGIVPSSLKDSLTGVFVGICAGEYAMREASSEGSEVHFIQGTSASFAAGRLAYALGLQGPALSVDTACSSSLVALHLACQALRQGECNLALAAGVSLMVSPQTFVILSRLRALAPDGRSKTFSANADGYGRGEGVVVLALERLGDALARGHRVLALVRGTAVNHDGASSGLTAPNGTSQQKVLRAALHDARITPADVDVVECHGTGTSLGDPIEVQALAAVYAEGRPAEKPVLLGALKTNIGHLEAASGLAGVAKMVASLRHDALPPTLHATPRNPLIEWDAFAMDVVDTTRPWPRHEDGSPRRAGVSAFGFSGTNAHVILEEAPAIPQAAPTAAQLASEPLPAAWPVLLSAKSEPAVRAQAQRLRDHLVAHDDLALVDVAYSLATTRAHFEHRAALLAHDRDELLSALDSLAQGKPAPNTVLGRSGSHGKVVFVFPGQGSQWDGMALSLLDASPVFRTQLEACERALAPHVDWSLLAVLRRDEGAPSLDRVDVVQPALFAVMVSLAALWRSLGVEPAAVVGHSQGEIAAAFVAGALSLEDAARIAALRSKALTTVAGKGAMAAVELGASDLQSYLAPWGDRLSIAAVNSPRATLVSGEPAAVDALLEALTAAQLFARKIRVDYASHSAQMDAVRAELLADLESLAPRACTVPLYSTVTGTRLDGSELDGAYWYRNLRQTVLFSDATERLLDDGHRFFVEVSPHPVLTLALRETCERSPLDPVVVGSVRRDEGHLARLLLSWAELSTRGLTLDWNAFFAPFAPRKVSLPTYPFQRERFWLDASTAHAADVASAGLASADHPLLGAAVALADRDGFVFTGRLSLAEHPWLEGHAVFGIPVLPGAALLELALHVAHRVGLDTVEELTLDPPPRSPLPRLHPRPDLPRIFGRCWTKGALRS
ncbi:SDR family NAD(P)-dependent oxidoreductase [Sorangium sp. So ce315]|uniref:type I polyketide synthase n=1 Tax=Sorangium sp. So ce315 TaxID=3133299 RepID=UPI003F60B308